MRNLHVLFIVVLCLVVSLNAQVTDFPWTESFDGSTFPPTGWLAIDHDNDSHNWHRRTSLAFDGSNPGTINPHTGSGFAASGSVNDVGNDLSPNNWLITPQIHIPSTGSYLLHYFVNTVNQWRDHYGVYVSTTGTNVGAGTGEIVGDFRRLFTETPP